MIFLPIGVESMEITRGDIFIADLNPVQGSEQGGVRPVLVIQNDRGNRFSPTVICAAMTSAAQRVLLFHAKARGVIAFRQ